MSMTLLPDAWPLVLTYQYPSLLCLCLIYLIGL